MNDGMQELNNECVNKLRNEGEKERLKKLRNIYI